MVFQPPATPFWTIISFPITIKVLLWTLNLTFANEMLNMRMQDCGRPRPHEIHADRFATESIICLFLIFLVFAQFLFSFRLCPKDTIKHSCLTIGSGMVYSFLARVCIFLIFYVASASVKPQGVKVIRVARRRMAAKRKGNIKYRR